MTESQDKIQGFVTDIQEQLGNGSIPEITIPTRSKSNIVFDENDEVWVYGDKMSTRSAQQLDGAQKILKMLYTLDFIDEQLDKNQSSTLRELYYQSESWEDTEAHFSKQDESNQLIEDLEILFGDPREEFNLYPEESGASLIGDLTIEEETNRGSRKLHLQDDVGQSGYTVPNNPDNIKFLDHNLDFVLCVETGGMRDRLVSNKFDEEYNSLIVHLKGQPARATRRTIHRVNQRFDLPVLVFCDGDPWSYRIFCSVAYGSIKSAHLSRKLATPSAQYLGITPEDIVEYDLPTEPLNEQDVNALENELEDPRFENNDFWVKQIKRQLEIGEKAEQQSLASHGLSFVTDTYLPQKIDKFGL